MADEIANDEPQVVGGLVQVQQEQNLNYLTQDEIAELPAVQRLVLQGDLGGLTKKQQTIYIKSLCGKLGIRWESRPFQFFVQNGKTVLYAGKDCADQLRAVHGVSIQILERVNDRDNGIFYVRVKATLPSGREDESMGAVGTSGKGGDELANLYLKAETKAKRRVTYSILGLGLLDETEVSDIGATPAKTAPAGPRRMVPPSVPTPDLGGVRTVGLVEEIRENAQAAVEAEAVYVTPHVEAAGGGGKTAGSIPVSPYKPKQPLPPVVPPVDIGG